MNGRKIGQKLTGSVRAFRLSGKTLSKITGRSIDDPDDIIGSYQAYKYTKYIMLALTAVFVTVLMAIDIGLGKYHIGIGEVYSNIFNRLLHWGPVTDLDTLVVWEYRMPRVLAAIFAGLGLAMAGAAMQSMMKNPLADPYTTGISSGAAFGATLAMVLGITIVSGDYGTVINAFVFAMVPALFIIAISTYRKPSPAMIILSGIALMYIFNAVQSYMMLVSDPDAASAVYAWTVGSLNSASWSNVPAIAAVSLVGGCVLFYLSKILNTMNSGDAYSKSIGIDVNRARIIILVSISIMAAGIVSFTGIIGFVGLVGPHIARMFVGSDNKVLIPAAGMIGACVMLLADCVVQSVSVSMPVGIITSIIGGPIFMLLIIGQKKEVW